MLLVEGDLRVGRAERGADRYGGAGVLLPFTADPRHQRIERREDARTRVALVLHARDVQDLVHDALQPLRVLAHHLRQPLEAGVGDVLVQQRIGLHDGRQRIADFMRDSRGHAAHADQLFGTHARLQLALVLQENHAQALGGIAIRRGHAGAYQHALRAGSGMAQLHGGSPPKVCPET